MARPTLVVGRAIVRCASDHLVTPADGRAALRLGYSRAAGSAPSTGGWADHGKVIQRSVFFQE